MLDHYEDSLVMVTIISNMNLTVSENNLDLCSIIPSTIHL